MRGNRAALRHALDTAARALVAYQNAESLLEGLVEMTIQVDSDYTAGFRAGLSWEHNCRPGGPWVSRPYLLGFNDGLNAQHGTRSYAELDCTGCGGIGHMDEICSQYQEVNETKL